MRRAPARGRSGRALRGNAPRRADARRGQLLGREQRRRQRADRLRLDGIDLGDDPVDREQLGVGDERLAEPVHPGRGRLHRDQDAPLEVLLRAVELALREVAGGDVGDLLGGDRERFGEIVLPRPDVDADLTGIRVLRHEPVHGVRKPALLADLLEQPRRGRAAEDRVEQRDGEAASVRARDSRCPKADVVLLGVLALEAQARRRRLDERRAHHRPGRLPGDRRPSADSRSPSSSSWSTLPAAETTMFPGMYFAPW